MLVFHQLTVDDRDAVQAITLKAGRRNCNFTFANLVGWQFWYQSAVRVLPDAVVLRFLLDGERAYLICTKGIPSCELVQELYADCDHRLMLVCLEDEPAMELQRTLADKGLIVSVESQRDLCDYIYRRADLATLHGGKLQAKRNHVNRFVAEHPDFEYCPLEPSLFGECRRLSALWHDERAHDNPAYGDTIYAEKRVMETVFSNWDELGMRGGSIFAGGRMVAFTYGAAVTEDTFDVLVEKADRSVEGAFSIINQQFCAHLPEQFTFVNREEDLGLPGLRKSKLSYHPEILLSYNVLHIT